MTWVKNPLFAKINKWYIDKKNYFEKKKYS